MPGKSASLEILGGGHTQIILDIYQHSETKRSQDTLPETDSLALKIIDWRMTFPFGALPIFKGEGFQGKY